MESVKITGMTHEGAGVGRLQNGMAVFVPGALPGEQVKIKILKRKKRFALAQVIDLETVSPQRVLPPCPTAEDCGGCHIQHLQYEEQLKWKRRQVEDAIRRLGGLEARVLPVKGMLNPWGYRNKAALHVKNQKMGFYQPRSREIIDFSDCSLLPTELRELAAGLARLLPGASCELKNIILRRGWTTGEILVVLETGKRWQVKEELVRELTTLFPAVVGVVVKPEDEATRVLYGRDYIEERLGGLRFYISSTTFFQVNSLQAEVLYHQVQKYAGLKGGEEVLDVYCGSGSIALWLSREAGTVAGIEAVAEAVSDAYRNAALNGIYNVEFYNGPAEEEVPRLAQKGCRPDLVILDPPRAGCHRCVLDGVAFMKPERIVYVSCNPATLARDLAYLEEKGYKTRLVQPVDMFPHTYHIECVVSLKRKHSP